jgi:hypothetical protein
MGVSRIEACEGLEARVDTHKMEMAQLLRGEAEHIHRHGLTNFFGHTFACARYGQAMKAHEVDRCGPCPMRAFVPAAYIEEAYPCQHINEQGWDLAAADPKLAGEYEAWLVSIAKQLEAEATTETPPARAAN